MTGPSMDPRIDELQDISLRLREGSPLSRKRLIRDEAGRITGADETHHRFDAGRLIKADQALTAKLSRASLPEDAAVFFGACVADFLEAAAPYVSTPNAAALRTQARETRERLGCESESAPDRSRRRVSGEPAGQRGRDPWRAGRERRLAATCNAGNAR